MKVVLDVAVVGKFVFELFADFEGSDAEPCGFGKELVSDFAGVCQ